MSNYVNMFCPKCNAKITGSSQFCRTCAFDLSEAATSPTAAQSKPIPRPAQPNLIESPVIAPEISGNSSDKIYVHNETVKSSDFVSTNRTQIAAQKQTGDNGAVLDNPPKEGKDLFFVYIAGAIVLSFFIITGGVIWFISYVNANQAYIDANRTTSYIPSNVAYQNSPIKNSSPSSSNTASSYQPASNTTDTSSFSSSLVGRDGRLTINANLRGAPNKNASSIGIHFQGARVRISNVEFYDTDEGLSTWYKIQITEYGCDAQGNLGCGKNSENDADEGWMNARSIRLD